MNKNDKLKKALGDKLRTLRDSKGLSVRALAALADIDHSQIHRIEKGDISPSAITIQKLADALEVTPCAFFDC
jgi:transcriptional regulator with XRE-family HTH domain